MFNLIYVKSTFVTCFCFNFFFISYPYFKLNIVKINPAPTQVQNEEQLQRQKSKCIVYTTEESQILFNVMCILFTYTKFLFKYIYIFLSRKLSVFYIKRLMTHSKGQT